MRKTYVVLRHASAAEFERQLNERDEEGYKLLALTCSGGTFKAVMRHPPAGRNAEKLAKLFQSDPTFPDTISDSIGMTHDEETHTGEEEGDT